MLMLLECFKKFKEGEFKSSPNVLEWTNVYKEEADKYGVFMSECTEDSEEHVSGVILYEAFKNWQKNYQTMENLLLPTSKINGHT